MEVCINSFRCPGDVVAGFAITKSPSFVLHPVHLLQLSIYFTVTHSLKTHRPIYQITMQFLKLSAFSALIAFAAADDGVLTLTTTDVSTSYTTICTSSTTVAKNSTLHTSTSSYNLNNATAIANSSSAAATAAATAGSNSSSDSYSSASATSSTPATANGASRVAVGALAGLAAIVYML